MPSLRPRDNKFSPVNLHLPLILGTDSKRMNSKSLEQEIDRRFRGAYCVKAIALMVEAKNTSEISISK
jgi:hypothetical protein